MPNLHAYLSFNGNCAEAMRFYARVLGAQVETQITYAQVPGDMQAPPEAAAKIMHAHLVHKDFELMAGDIPPGMSYEGVKGVMLALTFPTAAEAQGVFAALAEGGTVQMPPGETFWAATFGMLTDRFGIPWGINGAPKPVPKL